MLKPFKVTSDGKLVKKGVMARGIADLCAKFACKFNISLESQNLKVFLEDGTEVDDDEYLMALPDQTVLLVSNNHHSGTVLALKSLLENWVALFPTTSAENQTLLQKSLSESMPRLISLIQAGSRSQKSTIAEDPTWFQFCVGSVSTKEAYLFKRAQERIRGYFQKCREQLQNNNHDHRVILNAFKAQLKVDQYFGNYFNRAALAPERFCDSLGLFKCQGAYQKADCHYLSGIDSHMINPYDSWESRVLFSTWNLDHMIERSRTIVPEMIKAVQKAKKRTLNWRYFYALLFTQQNLRLVHIVCHDKRSHDADCDSAQFYLS